MSQLYFYKGTKRIYQKSGRILTSILSEDKQLKLLSDTEKILSPFFLIFHQNLLQNTGQKVQNRTAVGFLASATEGTSLYGSLCLSVSQSVRAFLFSKLPELLTTWSCLFIFINFQMPETVLSSKFGSMVVSEPVLLNPTNNVCPIAL